MLVIERIDAEAWRVYRDLRLAALADAPYAFGSRLERERALGDGDWRERLARRAQFVALLDGVPVGTIGCRPEDDHVSELVSLWVAPEARGSGVADRLVTAALGEAAASGSVDVVLWVSDENEPAERLYTRHGFARTGRVQPIDDDDPVRGHEYEMRRRGRSSRGRTPVWEDGNGTSGGSSRS